MFPSHLAGVLFGVLSALIWGSADFSGGLATRRIPPFQVVVLGSFSGALSMALLAWLRGEKQLAAGAVYWALAAGVLGALGIAALYHGLATGNASLVAPTAAVIGAALPVVAGILLEGLPRWNQSLGLFIGVLGIWQVSSIPGDAAGMLAGRPSAPPPAWRLGRALSQALRKALHQAGLVPAVLAGIAFSGFFVCLAQSENQAASLGASGLAGAPDLRPIFLPLVVAKLASLLTALLIVGLQRQPLPAPQRSPLALLSGVLDAGGNLFYLLAQQVTRLDIAVTISSMYPVSTVVLAAIVLKQKVNRQHWLGLGLCLVALALIVA